MKMPKKIKLACFEYEIKDCDRKAMGDSMGDLDRVTKIVRITKDLPDQVKKETFLHELLHVALDEYGLDYEAEEKFVRLLSPRLMELFQRNPKLLEALFE